jgi:hypothetical protein
MGVLMIPFKSFLGFKRVDKTAWINKKLEELESEYSFKLKEVERSCSEILERKKEVEKKVKQELYEVDELLKRVLDKKIEIENKNKDLLDQIRLIEAKASPDQVWASAFSLGFSKAWDMMLPILYDGFGKVKEEISNSAKIETLRNLQPVLRPVVRGNDGTHPTKD